MLGILMIAAGIFTIVGSLNEWGWYWNNWRARMWVSLFGQTVAKYVLGIIGTGIMLIGIWLMMSGK